MFCVHDDNAPCAECAQQEGSGKSLSRHDQRAMVFHLLYAMDAFEYQVSLESIADNLSRGFGYSLELNGDVFQQAEKIVNDRDELDEEIKPLLDNWKFERLGVCTRLILRLALWELKYTKIDHSVVIDEAIELAKSFAETDAYKFINGVLDEWVKRNKPEAVAPAA